LSRIILVAFCSKVCYTLGKGGIMRYTPIKDPRARGYSITDYGDIMDNIRNKHVQTTKSGDGTLRVTTRVGGNVYQLSIAKLVWQTYIGPLTKYQKIYYINGLKSDVRISNLCRYPILRYNTVRG
jgi:hypothetical protein